MTAVSPNSLATEVAGEGSKAAAVTADLAAIHPDSRFIIHRLKMQENVAILPVFRNLHFAPIPDRFHEIKVFDAG